MFETLTKFLDSFIDIGVPGVDLAVYRGGESIFRHMSGCSDLETKTEMNGKERYNIYSCSKAITCAAALQLWEKKLFSLDDRLSDYMPEFAQMTVATGSGVKKAENPILIKHLFEMTAGFSYDTESPWLKRCREETDGRCPTREAIKYLAREPLLFEPGDQYKYSLCHDVLAALVEVLTGERFGEYVKKNIFDAVGMRGSTFLLPESEIETICPQYRFENGAARNVGKHILSYKLGSEYESGGAGCISTVDDYMKLLEGLRTFKLLKPETVALMSTDRLTDYQKRTYPSGKTHGYGLGFRCPKGDARYTDFGWGGAAGAYWAIDMSSGLSIFCAMHLLCSPVQGLRSLLCRFVKAELFDKSAIADIQSELKRLHGYDLTY